MDKNTELIIPNISTPSTINPPKNKSKKIKVHLPKARGNKAIRESRELQRINIEAENTKYISSVVEPLESPLLSALLKCPKETFKKTIFDNITGNKYILTMKLAISPGIKEITPMWPKKNTAKVHKENAITLKKPTEKKKKKK